MLSDKQKHVDFLAGLTEQNIYNSLNEGEKNSCILFTNIIFSLREIGSSYNAPGITLAYGRHNSPHWTTQEIVQMVMDIVKNSLKNYEITKS